MQYLYQPSLLVFGARIAAQIRIAATAHLRPRRSLFTFAVMLTLMNMFAAFLHWLDFPGGSPGGKGLILDFIGQGVSGLAASVAPLLFC